MSYKAAIKIHLTKKNKKMKAYLCLPASISTRVSLTAVLLILGFTMSCRKTAENDDCQIFFDSIDKDPAVLVETLVMEKGAFYKEIRSNGRLRANRKLSLTIALGEELKDVKVRNGEHVKKGQTLAILCSDRLNRQLERANIQLIRASLDMEDVLLGQGYGIQDSLIIPEFTWQMAGVRSGYFEALKDVRSIEEEMRRVLIRAPFDGVVADLVMEVNDIAAAGDVLCKLIDMTEFFVVFPMMEQELAKLEGDLTVEIHTFSRPEMKFLGYVQSINPMVDDYGQLELTAVIDGAPGLLDGMNVNVSVRREIPAQMVVPRSAVLLRDGEELLFKYLQGRAIWTYVNVLHTNSTHYSVIADPKRVGSLEPGDTIIVSDNIHLAHGSTVMLRNE